MTILVKRFVDAQVTTIEPILRSSSSTRMAGMEGTCAWCVKPTGLYGLYGDTPLQALMIDTQFERFAASIWPLAK